MTKRVALYIPGLGDRRRGFFWAQRLLLWGWRLHGYSVRIFTVDWASRGPFDKRFQELLGEIDRWHERGVQVSLIGVSAGASTALLGLQARPSKVVGVVTICGQITVENALRGPAARVNPRFLQSLERRAATSRELSPELRRRVLTLRPRSDAIVPLEEQLLSGAQRYEMPVDGHLLGIGFAIGCEAGRATRFLTGCSL